ncbi:MAG: hypothetical protein JSV92_00065 [archaeon]|nr:MAG: hypothetical protein JSV92_00065 [archaeon]
MPNAVPLKYKAPFQGPYTEEQLLTVFHDLKENYSGIRKDFTITNQTGNLVKDFGQLLRIAVSNKPEVILKGSGEVGGLKVENGLVEYDLSEISKSTEYWDILRDGSCSGCNNLGFKKVEYNKERICKIGLSMDHDKDCSGYDPKRKNSQGEPARKLDELIEVVSS